MKDANFNAGGRCIWGALIPLMLALLMGCGSTSTAPAADGDEERESETEAEKEKEAETQAAVTPPECIADRDCTYPILNAHRGLCGDEPENTIAAFLQCEAFGVPMFEIDLRQTSDGKIVLMHDSSVERTTDGATRYPGRVNVSQLTLAEFKALVISDERCTTAPEATPDRCHPATFAELLARTKANSVLFLDFKDGEPQVVAADINAADAKARVIFFDSDLARLRAYRQAVPGGIVMPRAQSVDDYATFLAPTNDDLELLWIHGDPEHATSVKAMLKEKRVRLYFNLFTLSDLWFGYSDMVSDPKKKAENIAKAHKAMDDALLSGGMGFGTEYAHYGATYLYPHGFGLPR